MKTSERLLNASKTIWDAYNEHPFVLGIQNGTLERDKFRYYIMQDFLYLKDYAKTYAVGVAKAKSVETANLFAKYINVMNGELDVHKGYMGKFAVTQEEIDAMKPSLDNLSYTSYMVRVAYDESEVEVLAAVLSCAYSYEVIAKKIVADNQDLVTGSIEGLYTFTHPFGCSQTGHDHAQTRKLLAALVRHPNAAAVLVLHLGCENLQHDQFVEELGEYDHDRVKFLTCQDVDDELVAGREILKELAAYAAQFQREPIPSSELVVGMKCGGSDGLSGITANPTIGRFSDMLCARGGSTVLTEVPEMFGAEGFLMDRCQNEKVFEKAVHMINGFKEYFISHNEVVYDNPSPGNKQGGITTLEDKSCGCVQKGGSAPIMDVIGYGDAVTTKGLNMLYGPGNDLVSATALTAAGAHMILFSTGRGTPFGAPAPTLKIATNSQLAAKKSTWIDFNAGVVADGEKTLDEAGADLYQLVLDVASGKQTCAEKKGFREISIFKDGVVL